MNLCRIGQQEGYSSKFSVQDGKYGINKLFSILINPRSNFRHVNPNIIERCMLQKKAYEKLFFVQLATGTKLTSHGHGEIMPNNNR